LSIEWQERLKLTLDELNRDVYGGTERFSEGESSFVERTTGAPGAEPGSSATPPLPPASTTP
jgi:hypothetical protein